MPTISSISSTRGCGTTKVILHYKKLFFYVDKYSISYISDDPDNCKVGRLDCTMTCTRDRLTLRWQLGRILGQTNLFILHCFHILNLMIICHLKNKKQMHIRIHNTVQGSILYYKLKHVLEKVPHSQLVTTDRRYPYTNVSVYLTHHDTVSSKGQCQGSPLYSLSIEKYR